MKGVVTRVWTISIPVSSFDKALSFYRDLLGLQVQLDGRMFNWMELGPEEPHTKLGLYEHKDGIAGRKPGGTTGINFWHRRHLPTSQASHRKKCENHSSANKAAMGRYHHGLYRLGREHAGSNPGFRTLFSNEEPRLTLNP